MGQRNVLENIRIVHYIDKHIADPWATRNETSWQDFHRVRNSLLDVFARHGTVGPLGKCPLSSQEDVPTCALWEPGTRDPDFWVADDQYSHERYLYCEILRRDPLTLLWLADVQHELAKHSNWGLCLTNIRGGYCIFLSSVLLVNGSLFRDVEDLEGCIEVIKMNLDLT